MASDIASKSDYYNILGVRPGCNFADIKKAYRKLALQCHPDKNQNHRDSEEQFKILNHAYKMVSKAEKKKDGEKGSPNSHDNNFNSRFNFEFNTMNGNEHIVRLLHVTLEDIYNGCTRTMPLQRLVLCRACEGTGETSQIVNVCATCKGFGRFEHKNGKAKLCGVCNGAGRLIIPSYMCETCDGKKMVWDTLSIDVPVDKGMKSGNCVIYQREGNQLPDGKFGHLVFLINVVDHPVFKRIGYDLAVKVEVQLQEAIIGFKKYIDTLDGRTIEVHAYPGELFCLPENIKVIMNEGMPTFENPAEKGALIVQFIIKAPQNFVPYNMFGFPVYQSEEIHQNGSAEIPTVSADTSAEIPTVSADTSAEIPTVSADTSAEIPTVSADTSASETQIPADCQSASPSTHQSATVASETHQNIATDHHAVNSKTSQNSADIFETRQNIAAASKTHHNPVEAIKTHHKATTFTNYENEADIRVDESATLSSRPKRSVAGIKTTRSSIFTIRFNLRKKPYKRSASSKKNTNKMKDDDEPMSAKKVLADEEPMSTDEVADQEAKVFTDEEAMSANADGEPMITNEVEVEPLDLSFKIARM